MRTRMRNSRVGVGGTALAVRRSSVAGRQPPGFAPRLLGHLLRHLKKGLAPGPARESRKLSLLSLRSTLLFAFGALVTFHLAFTFARAGFLVSVFLFCMFSLSRAPSRRAAIYTGAALGIVLYAPHLGFFFRIFGFAAVALWMVMAFWTSLFLFLSNMCVRRCERSCSAVAVPVIWLGQEFFRSELYYLRFSWLAAGYAFSDRPGHVPLSLVGVYGAGFVLMLLSGLLHLIPRKAAVSLGVTALIALSVLNNLPPRGGPGPGGGPLFVGVQLEDPTVDQVVEHLDRAIGRHPDADLVVLSEYSFHRGVPEAVRRWCRNNQRHLILGSVDHPRGAAGGRYNTAFVVAPDGEVAFKQAKSVPVQFFQDGLPAARQDVWDSPWGKVGICICYDLSYTRVTDRLVRMGARVIVVPTMDVERWGEAEHTLAARVAPIRAAEYGLPVFRLASSGISQVVRADGVETARAPFPGQGEIMAARITMADGGSIPIDRCLGLAAVIVCAGWLAVCTGLSLWRRVSRKDRTLAR